MLSYLLYVIILCIVLFFIYFCIVCLCSDLSTLVIHLISFHWFGFVDWIYFDVIYLFLTFVLLYMFFIPIYVLLWFSLFIIVTHVLHFVYSFCVLLGNRRFAYTLDMLSHARCTNYLSKMKHNLRTWCSRQHNHIHFQIKQVHVFEKSICSFNENTCILAETTYEVSSKIHALWLKVHKLLCTFTKSA